MHYATPTLVVLGPAPAIVLGGPLGRADNLVSNKSRPEPGIELDLED